MSNRPESNIERNGDVSTVTKSEGIYTILYDTHFKRIDPTRLPHSLDGVFIETGTPDNYVQHPAKSLDILHKYRFHRDLIDELARQKVPIYFGDLALRRANIGTLVLMAADWSLEAAEGLFPVAAAFYLALNNKAEWIPPLLLPALWATLNPVSGFIETIGSRFGIDKNRAKEFRKFALRLHPELAPLTLRIRNHVLAHKEQWLAQNSDSHSHLSTILAPDHLEIEDVLLKTPEQRLEYLKKTKFIWGWTVAPETFYSIQKLDYRRNKWIARKVIEVPDLKVLVS